MKVAGKDFDAGFTVAACGHVIPEHHKYAWHDGDTLYCSAECMGDALQLEFCGAPMDLRTDPDGTCILVAGHAGPHF